MKNILALLVLIIVGFIPPVNAQSSLNLHGNSKYEFVYNDKIHTVLFMPTSNTFIEYDENGNKVTDGNLIMKKRSFTLMPVVKSGFSLINLDVYCKIVENLPDKIVVDFTSSEVKSRRIELKKQ